MIGGRLKQFRKQLTTSGENEPLNKLSVAVIILQDLFILNLLFFGLNDHTQQLTSPDEYLPHTAREIFIEGSWSAADRMDELQPLILSDWKNYRYRRDSIFEEKSLKRMHPVCREFYEKAKTLSQDEELRERFVQRERLIDERASLIRAQDQAKRAYDTQLLETIAGKGDASTEAIANRSKQLSVQIEDLTRQLGEVETQINAHSGVQALWILTAPENTNREQVVKDFRRYDRWYPVKEFGWQLIFMLPIFMIFLAWCRRSARLDRRIQMLISSHLLVVASLPILIKLIEVVVDLIPNQFFRSLFNILKSLHLIAIWHYLVIIAVGGIGFLLVFLIQKKIFSRERTQQKRLGRGACICCGNKLPAGASTCPFCGTGQLTSCGGCQSLTPSAGSFCIHCGAVLPKAP